jgi:phenylalanine-4-hydroxylase
VTATELATSALPAHLRRHVVDQEWDAYTPRDHAVWRHVLGRLVERLRDRAHESYLHGLEATGIGVERIPRLDEMNEKLSRFGWSAVAVRGFLPPAVFTELQGRRVLAIAADIRSPEHVEYTPAPDIIHESAGHAPILADARYAEYVRRCGEVGGKAIASVDDDAVFRAIRHLSIVKEDPGATPEEVRLAEERLAAASASRRFASEGVRASRLYWWTAEYGLVGTLEAPRLYGAWLLSSLGESLHCLGPAVRREPLTAACADAEFDITEMQPRLFVVPDFEALFDVLESVSAGLSFRVGGDHGLGEALRAGTVNHVRLSDGREVTGRVTALAEGERPAGPGRKVGLVRIDGPLLLSRGGVAEGSPIHGAALVALGREAPLPPGPFRIDLPTGLHLAGFSVDGQEVLGLRAWMGSREIEVPSGCQLLVARSVPSVAGGPADPAAWDRWFGEGGEPVRSASSAPEPS